MTGIEIVRQRRVGFGAQGQSVASDEVYVKILVSFREMLPLLKGVRLHVFICVALHEAEVMLHATPPLSLSSIQGLINYSRNVIIDALDFLTERHFLEELPERGPSGEKQYRVAAYAWFGNSRAKLPGAKTEPAAQTSLKTEPVQKKWTGVEDRRRNRSVQPDLFSSSTQAAKKILMDAGIFSAGEEGLTEVTEEQAHAIAEWIKSHPQDVDNPAAYARRCLLNDPNWQPRAVRETGRPWYGEQYERLVRR